MSHDEIPDGAVSDPSEIPADVSVGVVVPVDIAGTPALVVLPRAALAMVTPDGGVVPDLLTAALREHGGRAVVAPPDFRGPCAPGWRVVLSPATGVTVTGPRGWLLYEGPLLGEPDWWAAARRDIATTGGLVVLAGAMTSPEDIGPAVAQGRASWVRAAVDIR